MKKVKPEFSLATVLANEVTKKQLLGFIEELTLSKSKIDSEKEAIRDILSEADTQLGIPSSILNDLVKEHSDSGSLEAKINKLQETKDLAVGLGITEE